MAAHALAILQEAGKRDCGIQQCGKYEFNGAKFLSFLIAESQAFNGELVNVFWRHVASCDETVAQNVERLRESQVSPDLASNVLFEGVDREQLDLRPIFRMAADYITHLGIPFYNPRPPDREHRFSFELVAASTDDLLRYAAADDDESSRRREALQRLALRRDGTSCLVTGNDFLIHREGEISWLKAWPVLTYILPPSLAKNEDSLDCLAMFAGTQARDLFCKSANSLRNIVNLVGDAHIYFNELFWGIEAIVKSDQATYAFRIIDGSGWLKDGDVVPVGRGSDSNCTNQGPDPLLCNIRLALARVLRRSGIVDMLGQLQEDADDSDFPNVYIASDYFCEVLKAKLLRCDVGAEMR